MTFDCAPLVKALWYMWCLLPLAVALLLPRFTRSESVTIVQQSWITFRVGASIAGSWMLLGLGLVPFLGVHGTSLGKTLLVAAVWPVVAGAWLGPTVVELKYRPAPSAVGQSVEFRPTRDARLNVVVSPTSGEAAVARFMVPKAWWNDAYARAGHKPVKGKVYKGGRDLWFARFD